jgi:hypothetical protein
MQWKEVFMGVSRLQIKRLENSITQLAKPRLSKGIFNVLVILFSVYLGWQLNSCSAEKQRRWEYDKVKAALKAEVGLNLNQLTSVLDRELFSKEQLRAVLGEKEALEREMELITKHFTENPFDWHSLVWENHIFTLALALDKATFEKAYLFYDSLHELTNLHSQIMREASTTGKWDCWKRIKQREVYTKKLLDSILSSLH